MDAWDKSKGFCKTFHLAFHSPQGLLAVPGPDLESRCCGWPTPPPSQARPFGMEMSTGAELKSFVTDGRVGHRRRPEVREKLRQGESLIQAGLLIKSESAVEE